MEAITREEQFMAAAAGQAVELPEPITRREKFLKAIAERGGGAQPDLVIEYSFGGTPNIVSGSVDAVLEKLMANKMPYITIFGISIEPDLPVFRQYPVTGISGYGGPDGSGRLYIHFMYFESSNGMSEERIFVFASDGSHEDTITNSGNPA